MRIFWSFHRQTLRPTQRPRVRLSLETLEGRDLLSGFDIVPTPTVTRSFLNATALIADSDIWAVGFTSPFNGPDATLAEHFNGTSWTVVATPNPAGTVGSQLSGVAAVSSNNVYAVGESATITQFGNTVLEPLIEHFDGTRWSVVQAPLPPAGGALVSVTADSANDIWAVGHLGNGRGGNLIEHFDGTSWSIVQGPPTAGVAALSGVSATSSTDVWAVGSQGRSAQAEILHFDGTTWSVVPNVPPVRNLNAVAALAPNNVWAVGSGGTILHLDGSTWTSVAAAIPGSGSAQVGFGFSGIAAASANDIYVVGAFGDSTIDGGFSRTLFEHWNGTSWSVVPSPNSTGGDDFLSGVATRSDGTAIAVGTAGQQNGPNDTNGLIVSN